MLLIILGISIVLTAVELGLVVGLLLDRHGQRSGTARLAVVLAVLAPLLIGLLMVLGIHLRRVAPFDAINTVSVAGVKAILGPPVPEPLAEFGGPALFGSFGLLALALSGLLLLLAVRVHQRRARAQAPGSGLACLGAAVLGAAGGLGALWTHLAGSRLMHAWDASGKAKAQAMAEALPRALQPAWLPAALWCTVGLLAVVGVWIAARRLSKARLETSGLLACALVLALGAGAFTFTRGHAKDATHGLRTMIDPQAGPVYQSALFGRLERGLLQYESIKRADGVQLPVSTAVIEPHWAIRVALSPDRLEVEGNQIVRLQDGRFPPSIFDKSKYRIEPLFSLLSKFREIEKQQVTEPLSNQIALQADHRLPYGTVFMVLRTAAEAGFPHARVVVRTERQELPSRLRVANINVSLPVLSDASSPGASLVRLGSDHPAPDPEPGRTTATVQITRDHIEATHFRSEDPAQGPVQKSVFEGEFDQRVGELTAWVLKLKEHYPKSDTVVLLPDDDVPWQEVITCLDATREKIVEPILDTRMHLLVNAVLSRVIR